MPTHRGRRSDTNNKRRKDNRKFKVPRPQEAEHQGRQPPRTREVRTLLEGIGTPPPAPFKPDPFQLEALAALEFEDVLVTAPTGSGKTWIAREEIRRLIKTGKRAWYTTPLKALTNSKYQEFSSEFGAEQVGILTGDRKENSDAPIIVGTTEIFRNQLFDSLRGGAEVNADLVVLRDDSVRHDQLGEGLDVARTGFDLNAEIAGRTDSLLGRGDQRFLDSSQEGIATYSFLALPKLQNCKQIGVHNSHRSLAWGTKKSEIIRLHQAGPGQQNFILSNLKAIAPARGRQAPSAGY